MSATVTRTRAESVVEAQRLRAQGLKFREIAERMDAPISTVDSWINDPDRVKQLARFARYGGECPMCGGPRDGHQGLNISDDAWCQKCRGAESHSVERASRNFKLIGRVQWTDEQILDALRAFYERYGTASVRAYRARRSSRRPSGATVINRFGSWNKALEEAGLPTTEPWRGYERIDPEGCVLAVQTVGNLIGGVPTVAAYDETRRQHPELGLPSNALVRIRWGTWVAVLEAAFSDTTESVAA